MTETAEWPRLDYESHPWDRDLGEPTSRRQALRSRGPYEAAVPPEIRELDIPLDSATAAAAEDATNELIRFDAEVGHIAAPFSAILLRTESASSSEIENLTSGARAIALAELGELRGGGNVNARLIVGNVHAMEAAIDLADNLDVASIIAMQKVLLETSAPDMTGQFRTQQVWVGAANSPHSASFVPPHHGLVPALMEDVLEFSQRTDLPILAQIAIAHAQFETIHPFPDGNGRTGRAFVQSLLRHHGVTRHVTVPVSAGLLQDTGRYFDALTAYRRGHVNQIVDVFAEASFTAVRNGRTLVEDLNGISKAWEDRTSTRAGSAGRRLLQILQKQPVIDAGSAAKTLGVTPQNAQAGIDRLVADGILTQVGAAARNRMWQSAEVLDALDEFAARAKRNPRLG